MDEQLEILASRELDGVQYILAVDKSGEDGGEEENDGDGEAVLILRGTSTNGDDEFVNFEAVGEEDDDFAAVLEIFADEFEDLGIEI
jgi:hypothetical protein